MNLKEETARLFTQNKKIIDMDIPWDIWDISRDFYPLHLGWRKHFSSRVGELNISVMFWFTIFKLVPLNIRKSRFSHYCDFFSLQ